MASKGSGTAYFDMAHHFVLLRGQEMILPVLLSILTKDIGYFRLLFMLCHCCPPFPVQENQEDF
jgi:hypothetical protein